MTTALAKLPTPEAAAFVVRVSQLCCCPFDGEGFFGGFTGGRPLFSGYGGGRAFFWAVVLIGFLAGPRTVFEATGAFLVATTGFFWVVTGIFLVPIGCGAMMARFEERYCFM